MLVQALQNQVKHGGHGIELDMYKHLSPLVKSHKRHFSISKNVSHTIGQN